MAMTSQVECDYMVLKTEQRSDELPVTQGAAEAIQRMIARPEAPKSRTASRTPLESTTRSIGPSGKVPATVPPPGCWTVTRADI